MTTLETLQALSDEELTEKVAVKVMRFPKGTRFNPLKNWNHTMRVINWATFGENKPTRVLDPIIISISSLGCCVTTFHAKIEDNNPQRAICIAALLAVSTSA